MDWIAFVFNTMKIFVISVLAAAVGASSSPQRKRSIENKYTSTNTDVIEEENRKENVAYLGYRKLEGSISMSMDNDGEY